MEYGKPGGVKLSVTFDELRRTYILPNQDTPSKLNEVYTAILKAEEWVNFVKYTATQAYKGSYTRGQRVSMIERIDSLRLENLKVRAMLAIERDRVNILHPH
ncbi:hypothetical protein Tco_0330017, partial [Tanacetum coccineum]